MFELIDCRRVEKTGFKMRSGFQPTNSLFFILKGEMAYMMGGERESAGENELVCFPDNVYFEREMLSPLTFFYLRFENKNRYDLPFGKIYIENKMRLISSFEYLAKTNDEKLKRHYLDDIFIQIETDKIVGEKKADDIVVRTEKFFKEHIKDKICIRDAADVSVSGLSLRFKQILGTSPMRYLNKMRLEKAETLLCRSELSIAEIAEECGFDNAYYFCNVFKKYNKLPPSKFRGMYGL